MSRTHPPLVHRATWILAAESLAVRELDAQFGLRPKDPETVAQTRETIIALMRSAADTHESLQAWIARIDDAAERDAQSYVDSLGSSARGFFDALSAHQMI